jgi:Glycosyltransferase family 87
LSVGPPRASRPRWARVLIATASIALFALLPAIALYDVFESVARGRVTPDFSLTYYPAAERLLDGDALYPAGEIVERGDFVIEYLYPPLTAWVMTPFTVLDVDTAELVFAALLVIAFAATLFVLGVRDWRCYGLGFLWPPVLDAIQTGNVTILLGLLAALVWRFRDREYAAGTALGVSLAVKILLWPLALWLAATRRIRAALASVVVAAVGLAVSWGAIGFERLGGYPSLLRDASRIQEGESYTVYALALDLGAPSEVARALWIALAAALVIAVVAAARRGDERDAFVLAVAATIACSPIVWLHYFSLLLVAVAVATPTLAPVWFLGLPMHVLVSTGVHNGSTFQNAAVLATAAVTLALAARSTNGGRRLPIRMPSPSCPG